MNRATAHAPRQANLVSMPPVEWLRAANDDVEGIEVTYLDVEEIELATDSVQAWRPS